MLKKIIVLVGLAVSIAGSASAATVFYTNQAAWNAAVSGPSVVENYESYGWSNPGGDQLVNNGSITLGGITYSFPDQLFGVGPNLNYSASYLLGNSYLEWQTSPNQMLISWTNPVTAGAFNFGGFYGNAGINLSVTLGNGDAATGTTQQNAFSFFGIITDTPFNTMTLNADQNYIVFDNLTYATGAPAVPEPSTLALIGVGIAGLVISRRRAKK